MLALEERKAAILKAIVQDYVRTGEPVGSKRLAEDWRLGVSSATVRSDMGALEDSGFITQPHTSAGRVPTDRGYRFFVDTLTDTGPLDHDQAAALQRMLLGSADLEELLRRTSTVLSRLTRLAALVVAPRLDHSTLRHIELVQLAPTSVLAVLIADTGRVDKRMLDLDVAVAAHDVQRASHAVNESAAGLRLSQAPEVIAGLAEGAPVEVRDLVAAVSGAVRAGLAGDPRHEQLYVGGTANIAGSGAFERVEQVKRVYEMLEEQVVLLRTLRGVLEEDDPAVGIGAELPLVELTACSVVAASYEAGGAGGSIGVLGPTRMDYPRTLAAVRAVASSLETALAELTGGRGEPLPEPGGS